MRSTGDIQFFCMSITDYPRASVSFPRDRRLGERDCMQPSTQASLSAKLICIYDTGLTEDIFPEPTARSAVPGVSPGRGLLILFCISGVESRCS